MCVTIEPGYYRIEDLLARARDDASLRDAIVWSELERFRDVRGIRIEDDVLVGAEGPEVTSAGVPKQVAEIAG
jgi:Xaa-Pro aminopeptidase